MQQPTTPDTFENRNTHFVLQFISPPQPKNPLPHHLGDISTPSLFEDTKDYSCIPNLKNTAVYLSETTYSGKLLNTHHKLRDESSNKFLFASSNEKYNIDAVYGEKYKYFHSVNNSQTPHHSTEDFYAENAKPLISHALKGDSSIIVTHGPKEYSFHKGNF